MSIRTSRLESYLLTFGGTRDASGGGFYRPMSFLGLHDSTLFRCWHDRPDSAIEQRMLALIWWLFLFDRIVSCINGKYGGELSGSG
jgi:hypothetical protein